jgi:hypothetical protein
MYRLVVNNYEEKQKVLPRYVSCVGTTSYPGSFHYTPRVVERPWVRGWCRERQLVVKEKYVG